MFSSSSSFASPANAGYAQDTRSSLGHSHAHPGHQSSFSVAGMSNPAISHNPALRGSSIGGGLGSSFGMGSSLGESRSHYQSGYLMSVAHNNASPQGSQRHEEVPIVQTKAKLNHALGGSASDFGMDSMFESSRYRHRQAMDDEDAPPMNSVVDLINNPYSDFTPAQSSSRDASSDLHASRLRASHPHTPRPTTPPGPAAQQYYVLVFGYPLDKYAVAADYFRSFGVGAPAEQSSDVINCFRIGYDSPVDAFRAVRKNGDLINGSWYVAAKWADVAQAEKLFGPALVHGWEYQVCPEAFQTPMPTPSFAGGGSTPARMSVDEPESPAPSATVGTPLRLVPATAAFRRAGQSAPPRGDAPAFPGALGMLGVASAAGAVAPSKGVLEQVSDLIFGW